MYIKMYCFEIMENDIVAGPYLQQLCDVNEINKDCYLVANENQAYSLLLQWISSITFLW